MPRQDPGEIGDSVKMLIDEIHSDAAAVAGSLFGEIATVDGVQLNKKEAADYIRNGWPDPKFRTDLLEQLGSERWFQAAHDAGITTLTPKQQAEIAKSMGPLMDEFPKSPPPDSKDAPKPSPVLPMAPTLGAPPMAGGVPPLAFPPPAMMGAPVVA